MNVINIKTLLIISILMMINFSLLAEGVCQDRGCNFCSNFKKTESCTECKVGYYKADKNNCDICLPNCQICKLRAVVFTNAKIDNYYYCQKCEEGYYINSKYYL